MYDDEKILGDVHHEETFITNCGKEIKNLKQLLEVLKDISPESFSHHVRDEKNDFATWVLHSVKDEELADMLEKTTDFEKTKTIIKDRIELLEKKIEVKNIKESLEDLKSDSLGIDSPADDQIEPVEDEPDKDIPKESLTPAEPPKEFVKEDIHPFEHLKKGIHHTIRDILVGVVIGMLLGYFLGSYLG